MENKSINTIRKVLSNTSWFRGDPYYWASASLPFAYASACVEVVSKENEKVKDIYNQIVESWGKPGIKCLYDTIWSEIPESKQEEVKQAFIHPEKHLLPDPDKAYNDIERNLSDLSKTEIDEAFINNKDVVELISLFLEFIIVGFNRTSDIEKERLRVLPSEKHVWLIFAIMLHSATEYAQITIEKLRNFYRLPRGGKFRYEIRTTNEPCSSKDD